MGAAPAKPVLRLVDLHAGGGPAFALRRRHALASFWTDRTARGFLPGRPASFTAIPC